MWPTPLPIHQQGSRYISRHIKPINHTLGMAPSPGMTVSEWRSRRRVTQNTEHQIAAEVRTGASLNLPDQFGAAALARDTGLTRLAARETTVGEVPPRRAIGWNGLRCHISE